MNRHHLLLWLLLLVAFAAFAANSIFGPINILGYEMRDSGMSRALTPPQPIDLASQTDTITPDTIAEKPHIVQIDTLSKTILIFGDSMLDGLYPRLAQYAEHNGHTLYAVIWYSSTSEIWGKSERLRYYIDSLHPDFIFVSLGANELFVKDIAEKRDKYVKKIIADIDTIPYIWIGPPNWREDTGINALIAANTAQGSYFKSAGMSFNRKADGAHPTIASANAWMDSIARWMPTHSSHPIMMEFPDSAASRRARRVFVHQPAS